MKKYLKPITIILFYFFFDLFYIIPLLIFNVDPNQLSVFSKTIYLISLNIVFIGVIVLIYRKDFAANYRDFQLNGRRYLKESINYWIYGLIIMFFSNNLIIYLSPNTLPANEQAIRDLVGVMPVYMVFATILYAPIAEETIFRKTLNDIIGKKWLYLIISSVAFGTAHVLTGFESVWDLLYIIPYGALGFAFAYSYRKTNNLFTPILLHMIHNSCLMLLYLVLL